MVCPTCRHPDGPCQPHPEALQEFEVILDENCWRRMYVPCNVRAFLAEYIDERKEHARILLNKQVEPTLVTHEGRSYNALFKHKPNYTKFYGDVWCNLAEDYDLRAGDRIEFALPDVGLNLAIKTYRGDNRLLPLPHVALDDLSSDDFDHIQCCVYSRDIELTYDQTRFLLQRLFRDIFIRCRPFVHVMTTTNTRDNIMKIPKSVVSTLKRWVDVPTNAKVTLEAPDEPTHVITPSSYSICKKDSRMVIEKSSFRDFLSAASFVEENIVLITFKERSDCSVSIILQRIP